MGDLWLMTQWQAITRALWTCFDVGGRFGGNHVDASTTSQSCLILFSWWDISDLLSAAFRFISQCWQPCTVLHVMSPELTRLIAGSLRLWPTPPALQPSPSDHCFPLSTLRQSTTGWHCACAASEVSLWQRRSPPPAPGHWHLGRSRPRGLTLTPSVRGRHVIEPLTHVWQQEKVCTVAGHSTVRAGWPCGSPLLERWHRDFSDITRVQSYV